MMMKSTHDSPILVTGAAGAIGAIGRNLTAILLARGHKVRALVRREDERADALRRLGALSGGHGQHRCGGAPSRRRGLREYVADDGDADEYHRDHRKPPAQSALAGGAGAVMVGAAGRHGAADGLPG